MTRAEILACWDAAVAASQCGWNKTAEACLEALAAVGGIRLAPPNVVAYGGPR